MGLGRHLRVVSTSLVMLMPIRWSPVYARQQRGQVSCLWLLRQRVLRRRWGVWNVQGFSDDQHGTGCLPDHVFCHTAQKHVGEPCPPMRPHDNQIHPLLARCVHNRLRRCALDEETLALEPGTLDLLQTRLQELLYLYFQCINSGDRDAGAVSPMVKGSCQAREAG